MYHIDFFRNCPPSFFNGFTSTVFVSSCMLRRTFSKYLCWLLRILPLQTGHPDFCVPARLLIGAFQTWPSAHIHHTFLMLPYVNICGVYLPFRVGCHCAAILGCVVARSLNPGSTFLFMQTGQPLIFEVRVFMAACHSWPKLQRHHTVRLFPALRLSGKRSPFLS